jgi:hypothetical protein
MNHVDRERLRRYLAAYGRERDLDKVVATAEVIERMSFDEQRALSFAVVEAACRWIRGFANEPR